MQRVEVKSAGLYFLWLCGFGLALIVLPYYLGSLIARNEWQMFGLLALGLIIGTLYFVEARYLILSAILCFFLAGSTLTSVWELSRILRWVFLTTLAVRALAHWILGRVPTRWRGADLWALSFIVLAFYSQTYSIRPDLTFQRSVSIALFYLAAFWGVWNYVRDEAKVWVLISDFLKVSFLIVLVGFLFLGKGRFAGFFDHPNAMGMFATLVMPLAVWSCLYQRKPWMFLLVLLVAASLILSGARAALLSTLIGTGYVLWHYYHKQKFIVLTCLIFFALFIFLYFELFGASGFAQYLRWDTFGTGSGRLEAWREVLRLIKLRPWLGYGFGTEDFLFYTFDIVFLEHAGAYAHNVYLGLTSQLGLIGAFLMFAPLIFFFMRHTYQIRPSGRNQVHWLQPALNGTFLGGLVNAIFGSWMYSAGGTFAFVFWVIVVLTYQLDRWSRSHEIPLELRVRS